VETTLESNSSNEESHSDNEDGNRKEVTSGLETATKGRQRWLTSIDLRGCEYTPQVGCQLQVARKKKLYLLTDNGALNNSTG
jgi:hypothetical protein